MDLSRAHWFKSSRSGSATNCVEVAFLGTAVGVRDSKDPEGPALLCDTVAWRRFTDSVGRGAFSR